ncbi:MAG: hypothetical protein AB1631_21310 [Acidobacteriota bacterium]
MQISPEARKAFKYIAAAIIVISLIGGAAFVGSRAESTPLKERVDMPETRSNEWRKLVFTAQEKIAQSNLLKVEADDLLTKANRIIADAVGGENGDKYEMRQDEKTGKFYLALKNQGNGK